MGRRRRGNDEDFEGDGVPSSPRKPGHRVSLRADVALRHSQLGTGEARSERDRVY